MFYHVMGLKGRLNPLLMLRLAWAIVRRVVQEWLSVVAKHLDFDVCVTAAVEALSR